MLRSLCSVSSRPLLVNGVTRPLMSSLVASSSSSSMRSFGTGEHVTEMGGSFKERERAAEERYFRELEARLLKNLSEHPELLKKAAEHAEKHVEKHVERTVAAVTAMGSSEPVAASASASSSASKSKISQAEFDQFKEEMMAKLKDLESRIAK
eukprot:EC686648.1.p2 GENE.EC686648.1~~EC686648.1.p2  ORF type:complete len:153 (+),score=70.89 EC686648.1:145-603(+)